MSSVEHHVTVDKGLKMKIKRKNVNVEKSDLKAKKEQSNTKSDNLKEDINVVVNENTVSSVTETVNDKSVKLSLFSDKEKSPKSKLTTPKKEKGKTPNKEQTLTAGSSTTGLACLFPSTSMEPKPGETASGKKDNLPDPYEFNAKVEDDISMPIKKIKLDKDKGVEMSSPAGSSVGLSASQDVSTDTHDVAVVTEPDCLGPCEPGTQVTLGGIVWHESENGVLVVNVTWRGKTYVGTLLDATRHDWAPPRFNCDSPTMELDTRTPKGRGKRRGAASTPVNNDTRTLRKGRRGSQAFTAPPSPAKSESSVGGLKRKGRPQDIDLSLAEQRSTKRSRSGSQAPTPNTETPPTDELGFIECPEPNCNKKYRNANGLKYHQSHAHGSNSSLSMEDSKDDMDCEDIPLSVVKNSVKKEKDTKKENGSVNKKDKDKANSSDRKSEKTTGDNSKKSEKSTSDNLKKSEKSEESENKEKSGKCDQNSGGSKKKESANNKSNAQTSVTSSGKFANNSVPKSVGSSCTLSSQVNTTNSVQSVPSQASPLVTSSLSSSSPSLTSSSTSVMQSTQGDTNKLDATSTASTKLVDIKPKITHENIQRVSKPNRPIVPAPTHAVLSNVQVTHSNLSPVMSHTQMSPQLKPIQPKPTIMGEPQNINPALADLSKDRKKTQKKKSKEGSQNVGNSAKVDQPTIKIERTGVIKTNPMPTNKSQTDGQKKDSNVAKDVNRSHLLDSNRSHVLTQQGLKNHDSSKSGQNPNLLKVASPLQVNTPDKCSVNDDVQSPAYSDISDANESASPAAPSETSPHKQKDDNAASSKQKDKSEPPSPAISESQMMPHYGMYQGYYGQTQFMNNMSPGQKAATPANPASNMLQQQSQCGPESAGKQNRDKGASTPTEEPSKGERRPEGEKDGGRPKGMPPHMSIQPPPANLSPQQLQEYQMMCAQQMQYHMQSVQPQYPYMPNGWYPPGVDPGYMRHMMDDQRRSQPTGEQARSDRDPGSKGSERESSLGPEGAKTPQGHSGGSKKDESSGRPLPSPHSTGDVNKKPEDKSAKDQALRDKQSENHQILKENIDIKNEMDRRQSEFERGRQEELRRYKMYQEQKQIEERKKLELARKGDTRSESLATKVPGTKPIMDSGRSSSNQRSGSESSKDMNIKREIPDPRYKDARDTSKDSNSSKYIDGRLDDKSKTPVSDKHRSETPTRNPETPKQRPGGSSSKSGSPCSMGPTSIPGSPSYSPFVNNYPYGHIQSPHFLGLEPTHPMYRNHNVNPALLGYHGSPYIHPSQMGYRPAGDMEDKDMKVSAQQKSSVNSASDNSDLKKSVGSDMPHYSGNTGNMHKIHELSEKGGPQSRNSSPGPVKPSSDSGSAVTTSVYDKHREFANSPPTQRHVHTHHHTHVLQPGPGMQPAGAPLPGAPGFAPVYDPYSAMFVSQAQSPHPYPPK